MKNILTVFALLLLITGTALAGSGYDECIKEEKALKAEEASKCRGFRYIFNPSACFATRKALKEYTSGTCKKIGMAENVDFSVHKVIPDKKIINNHQKVESEAAQQESTMEQLQEEMPASRPRSTASRQRTSSSEKWTDSLHADHFQSHFNTFY